jgi:hypothetical protein
LLVAGDFNFPTIKWNDENMGFNMVENSESANLFLECLNENFLFQNFNNNTFQNNINETTNVLDYLITESASRIFLLKHLPPLGNIAHGHHIIIFKLSYQNTKNATKDIKRRILYNKGKYNDFETFFAEINWENEFSNMNADECYNKWLSIYNEGCSRFIPTVQYEQQNKVKVLWMTKDLKNLIREKKTTWFKYRNSNFNDLDLMKRYRSLNKQVKKSVKQAITIFERDIAMDSKKNPKRIYEYINSKIKIKDSIRSIKDTNDTITTDGSQIVNILNNYFASVFCKEVDIDNLPACEIKTNIKFPDPIFDEAVIRGK